MTQWINVIEAEKFPPNTSLAVQAEDIKIAVFNLNGEFHAIEDTCTHDHKTLIGGAIEGDQVICPWHGARFDIKTGEALSAPAYDPVATFETRVESGMVQVAWSTE